MTIKITLMLKLNYIIILIKIQQKMVMKEQQIILFLLLNVIVLMAYQLIVHNIEILITYLVIIKVLIIHGIN